MNMMQVSGLRSKDAVWIGSVVRIGACQMIDNDYALNLKASTILTRRLYLQEPPLRGENLNRMGV